MKLATPLYILLIIAFCFLSISLILKDFDKYYPEAGNVTIGYNAKYINYTDISFVDIKSSDISSALGKVGDTGLGWRIFEAIIALPVAIINTIINLIASIPILEGIFTGISKELGIHSAIISIGMVAISVSIIIMLVKFYKGSGPV